MPEALLDKAAWWGDYVLGEGQAGCWHIGPMTLRIYRLPHEWRLLHSEDRDDPISAVSEVRVPLPPDEVDLTLAEVPEGTQVQRFSVRCTGGQLAVRPQLADRPLVIRPETPLYVTEGEAVTLYVSTPLWVRVEAGEPARLLQEMPSFRPSDTWYGPSTRTGELCYASRTLGRLQLSDLPRRRHRVITPIHLNNRASETLLVERIQLPVQFLSLYEADGYLWTQPIRLEREKLEGLPVLRIDAGPPAEAEGATLLQGPREPRHTSLIGRTFSTLIHRLREA